MDSSLFTIIILGKMHSWVSVHQQNFPSQSRNKPGENAKERIEDSKKGPFQCWGCGEPHLLRDFPHQHYDNRRVYYNV
jgi:hypothetical protein